MSNTTPVSNVHPISEAVSHAYPGITPAGAAAADFDSPDITFGDAEWNPDFLDVPFDELPSYGGAPTKPFGMPCALYAANTVFRVLWVNRDFDAQGKIRNRAGLFLNDQTFTVEWLSQKTDAGIRQHALVSVAPSQTIRDTEGVIRIQRLRLADQPKAHINLFATVPTTWVDDRDLVARASALWESLPRSFALLVNAVLWNGGRFYRYTRGPSSLGDHHAVTSGNFRHSVEVAELARNLGMTSELANVPLLVVGGLLHDAAKAAEYRYDQVTRRFRMSKIGELIGHRDTLIGWLAEARRTHGLVIGSEVFLGLMHMLFAAKGAGSWLGLREPRTREADILSQADQFSRMENLRRACAPAKGEPGFGRSHPNLSYRTYVTPKAPG